MDVFSPAHRERLQGRFRAGGAYTVTRLSDNTGRCRRRWRRQRGRGWTRSPSVPWGQRRQFHRPAHAEHSPRHRRRLPIYDRSPAQAAAAPVRTQATLTNTGNMVLAQGSVNTGYSLAGLPLTLTANTGAGTLTGFPAAANVVAFYADGSSTVTSGAASLCPMVAVPWPR